MFHWICIYINNTSSDFLSVFDNNRKKMSLIMKEELYNEIVGNVRKFRGLSRDCAYMLIQHYPNVSPNALHGIVTSEVQQKMKKNRGLLHSGRYNYLERYRSMGTNPYNLPGIILGMAAELDLSPTLFARVILEKYLQESEPQIPKSTVSKYMKDTTLIPDPNLAFEIHMCILYDDRYGLISDAFSRAIGFEYEFKLESYLEERKIPYLTEDKLRAQGYDKTPDVKFEIPIAVDGYIINWIESKARFGTPSIHNTHVREQFLSYWNRFGPGLVIYWFGFVDTIVVPGEKRFMILDHFPENITYMNPLTELKHLKLIENDS